MQLSMLSRRSAGVVVASAVLGLSTAASHSAIVEYRFDTETASTPPTSPSAGSDTTPVQLNVADLGPDGSGVSGKAGDRAFVNVTGGRANHAADDNAIDTLTSFTISGWLKSNGASALSSGRIMENASGVLILFTGAGTYQIQIDGNTTGFIADSGNHYSDTQKWMFFAVTYDGTSNLNNVKFYKGYRNSTEAGGDPSVQLVNTATIDQGTVNSDNAALNLLNRSAGDRTLDATLDNFRIDGTQAAGDSSGALTLSQLETYRTTDLVPEPATVGLLGVIATAGLLRRRRSILPK